MPCQRSAPQQTSLQPHRQPVQHRMKSAPSPTARRVRTRSSAWWTWCPAVAAVRQSRRGVLSGSPALSLRANSPQASSYRRAGRRGLVSRRCIVVAESGRLKVSTARYTGRRQARNVGVELRKQQLWACGAVVARVAYNDKPGPLFPHAVTSGNSHSCRSTPSIACLASGSEWH